MIVVDTNILIYRWLPGPKASAADTLVKLDPEWAAPALWRSELRNFLAGELRANRLSLIEAEHALRRAAGCLLAGEHLIEDGLVLSLVIRSKCSAYDCEFVALAHVLGTFLITEDKAILRAFPENCRSLSDALQGSLNR